MDLKLKLTKDEWCWIANLLEQSNYLQHDPGFSSLARLILIEWTLKHRELILFPCDRSTKVKPSQVVALQEWLLRVPFDQNDPYAMLVHHAIVDKINHLHLNHVKPQTNHPTYLLT